MAKKSTVKMMSASKIPSLKQMNTIHNTMHPQPKKSTKKKGK